MRIERLPGGSVEGLHRPHAHGDDHHVPDADGVQERQGGEATDEAGGEALGEHNQAALVASVGQHPAKRFRPMPATPLASPIAQGQRRTGELVDQPGLAETEAADRRQESQPERPIRWGVQRWGDAAQQPAQVPSPTAPYQRSLPHAAPITRRSDGPPLPTLLPPLCPMAGDRESPSPPIVPQRPRECTGCGAKLAQAPL